MELFILPLGGCCCNYEVIAPGVADGKRIHIPVPAYLIRLDNDELVLVDTGMNRIHIKDPDATWRGQPLADLLVPDMRREDSLLWRLAELDIAPADINYVINTHLHFDHAGNNDMLKDSKFFVQREHYEFAKNNPAVFPHQYWNLPGAELRAGRRRGHPVPRRRGHPDARPRARPPVGAAPAARDRQPDHHRGRRLLPGELRPRRVGRPGRPGHGPGQRAGAARPGRPGERHDDLRPRPATRPRPCATRPCPTSRSPAR